MGEHVGEGPLKAIGIGLFSRLRWTGERVPALKATEETIGPFPPVEETVTNGVGLGDGVRRVCRDGVAGEAIGAEMAEAMIPLVCTCGVVGADGYPNDSEEVLADQTGGPDAVVKEL